MACISVVEGLTSLWNARQTDATVHPSAHTASTADTHLGTASLPTCPSRKALTLSNHRLAHRHHLHPSFKIGLKSFPLLAEKRKKSSVTCAASTCEPPSAGEVLQYPSRKKPVRGCVEQGCRGCPSTLSDGSMVKEEEWEA